MKRLLWIITIAIATLALAGCSKSNPLVGTKWVAADANLDSFSVEAYTLHFSTETTGQMLYDNFRNDTQVMDFDYQYIEPNVIITYNNKSIKGIYSKDHIVFEGMGSKGSDMTFNKANN
jgi:hypothetical protein